jgi:anti-sigma factor RsiW
MTDRDRIDAATDEALSALIDGELGEDEARALRARIASEPALAGRLAALEAVDARLRTLPAPAVPADLRARLEARLGTPPDAEAGTSRSAPRGRLAAAAGLALAAGLAAHLYLAPARAPLSAAEETATTELEPSEAEIAIAIELDALRDFGVIDQLELLELLEAAGEGSG